MVMVVARKPTETTFALGFRLTYEAEELDDGTIVIRTPKGTTVLRPKLFYRVTRSISFSGWKSYAVSIILVLVGLTFLLLPLGNTWSTPDGEIQTAVRSVIGWIAILLGMSTAALRHAIQSLRDEVRQMNPSNRAGKVTPYGKPKRKPQTRHRTSKPSRPSSR